MMSTRAPVAIAVRYGRAGAGSARLSAAAATVVPRTTSSTAKPDRKKKKRGRIGECTATSAAAVVRPGSTNSAVAKRSCFQKLQSPAANNSPALSAPIAPSPSRNPFNISRTAHAGVATEAASGEGPLKKA